MPVTKAQAANATAESTNAIAGAWPSRTSPPAITTPTRKHAMTAT